MRIKEIMTPNPEIVQQSASIREASIKMKSIDVGALPVAREGNLRGIITDRDIVLRCLAENLDPDSTTVEQIMSKELVTCDQDDDIEECARVMEEKKLRRIVVTASEGKPIGIVSLGDISTKAGREFGEEVVSSVSEPSRPHR